MIARAAVVFGDSDIMQTIYVHLANEEPFMAEVEALPAPGDQAIFCLNPRKRDGKDLHYVLSEVQQIIVPWWRISFIEVMPSGQEEEIVAFYRD